jgi:electron transfer flavoprotein beta subunit
MDLLVCLKRVPMVGGRIGLLPSERQIDTAMLGFTVSPHEECAVEEAVRIVESQGGQVTVLTLGPPEAAEQLRDAVAVGASRCLLLEAGGKEWGPMATARAIAAAAEQAGPFDLILFGNEAADTADFQVGVRVAHLLGRPVATGIKSLSVESGAVTARREYRGVEESFVLQLPAVVSVKEGINLPRYPSLPGRMRAKKAVIETLSPAYSEEGLSMERLVVPKVERRRAAVLGEGREAVGELVDLLEQLGILS